MNYIDKLFHFYETTEAFETHRKLGLISPDSICFLKKTGQIYAQNTLFGICKERFEALEQLILNHDAKIKNILGIEGSSVNDGIVNNIADIVNFLDGFTDEDNLKEFIEALKGALERQIEMVESELSSRLETLAEEVAADSENLHNAITAINKQIEAVDVRLNNYSLSVDTINTNLVSHVRDYEALKTSYENFKSYTDTRLSTLDSTVSAINLSMSTLQQGFTDLSKKFDGIDGEISKAETLVEEARQLISQIDTRFDETVAGIEQFKRDINTEISGFKDTVGSPNGIAPLDSNAQIPAAYLPSFVDDVLEYNTKAGFPLTGETGKIYVALDDNLTYRWSGSTYVEISKSLGLGETASTAYPGNKGKKNTDDIAAHKADTNNPHNVTKTQLGLDKVNNTADADKPVSTAQAAAIKVVQDDLTGHKTNKSNPHEVTKAQVGLGNVDNTSDLDKPISSATQAALNVVTNSLNSHINDYTNPHNVTKGQVGLGNVDNTSDLEKPISTATQNALANKVDKIVGKGLSTNDFTNEAKNKLNSALTIRRLTSEEIGRLTEHSDGDLVFNTDTNKYLYWDGNTWKEIVNDATLQDSVNNIDLTPYETITGAAGKYQPKGNYLTQHQDISGLATKQEVATAVAGTTEQLKSYAKTADVEATYAKKSEVPSINGLISKSEADTAYQPKGNYLTEHQDISNLATKTEVAGKVDKISGKGLSTNDYTTAEKNKLAGIAAGAQVNTVTSVAGRQGAVTLNKSDVGLGSVDNTSDLDKPISSATQQALDGKADIEDLSNVLAEEIIEPPLLDDINALTREEIKKDLFIDMWNSTYSVNWIGYNKDTDRFFIKPQWEGLTFGLDDITYEEALKIYNRQVSQCIYPYNTTNIRINLPPYNYINPMSMGRILSYNNNFIHLLLGIKNDIYVTGIESIYSCPNLESIFGGIGTSNTSKVYTIKDCPKLKYVYYIVLPQARVDISGCPLLDISCFKFTAEYTQNTPLSQPATIYVHDDIMNKFTDESNTEWHDMYLDLTNKNIIVTNIVPQSVQYSESDDFHIEEVEN